jgi:hypothetical protein
MDGPAVEEEFLSQRRLPGIGMGNDRKRAPPINLSGYVRWDGFGRGSQKDEKDRVTTGVVNSDKLRAKSDFAIQKWTPVFKITGQCVRIN